MVASKYLYDEGEDEEVFNDDWAKAGKKMIIGKAMYIRIPKNLISERFCIVFRKQNRE